MRYVIAEISPALFLLYIFIACGRPARAIIIPTTVANIDKGDMLYNNKLWLPNSTGIIVALNRIIKAFENPIEIEVTKARWEEIKKLSSQITKQGVELKICGLT